MDSEIPPNLVRIEKRLHVCEQQIGVPGYDFRFQDYFACDHPHYWDEPILAIARMGAASDYSERFDHLLGSWNVRLVHTPEEYERTSHLPNWYPRISEFTPKSIWYESPPSQSEVENEFDWPVFVKGERQTSKHDRSMAIIEDAAHFRLAMERWRNDPILHWQRVVCRQYVKLRRVAEDFGKTIPKTFEFRSFWWRDRCVGAGPYWHSETYTMTNAERESMLALGRVVAQRMDVHFLVIDMAMAEDGRWIVIECNDGQDSGYSGVSPFQIWNGILRAIDDEDASRVD